MLPWTSMGYSMEFHGTLESPNIKNHRVPWVSMELGGRHFKWHKCSIELHGIFHGIPWNSGAAKFNSTKLRLSFYSIPCYPGLAWDIPWNSIELWSRQINNRRVTWDSMELGGSLGVFIGIPWNIPWNSMELGYRQMKYHLVPWNSMEYFMEFHGTLLPPNEISLSSMEFRRTLRLSFYSIPCYPRLSWVIPWNSMELWSRQIKKRVPSDSMELGERRFKWHRCFVEYHGIFHGIPWNSGVAK